MTPSHESSSFDAFKTDLKLAILSLKDEIRYEVKEASQEVLTEVRERLSRSEDERNAFYCKMDKQMDVLENLARATNGQVVRHKDALYGTEATEGLISAVEKGENWRKAMLAAGGAWLAFIAMLWLIWGDDVKTRGVLNRPAEDYVEFTDGRIHQWFPDRERPTVQPPPLISKKHGN